MNIKKAVSILEGEFPQLTYGNSIKDAWFFIVAKAKESRSTVRRKPPVQQRKGKICPSCDGSGTMWFADSFDRDNGKPCSLCKGTGRLPPVS
jgi:excinuclease UvrABC ATPase subunit